MQNIELEVVVKGVGSMSFLMLPLIKLLYALFFTSNLLHEDFGEVHGEVGQWTLFSAWQLYLHLPLPLPRDF